MLIINIKKCVSNNIHHKIQGQNEVKAYQECSNHGDYGRISMIRVKKALPPDRVEPKWPTPTALRR